MPLIQTVRFICSHPLNKGRKLQALLRYFRWQVGSRLLPGQVVVPFVDHTRLLISPGMAGATGNVYCGLHDFEEMGFVLHVLGEGDCLVDIGANVGTYSILAAGAGGAHVLSFEPAPATFAHLVDNVRLNRLENKVTALNLGLGSKAGKLRFSTLLDTTNHILADNEQDEPSIEVKIERLDTYLENIGGRPFVIKLDVEGFEAEVLAGGSKVLSSPNLLAVIAEENGCGNRYGTPRDALGRILESHALVHYGYDPLQRRLVRPDERKGAGCNQIYIRDKNSLECRVRAAKAHRIGKQIL